MYEPTEQYKNNMRETQYKIICFQCQFEYISKNIQLECSRCESRFLESIPMKRIPFTGRQSPVLTGNSASSSQRGAHSGFQLFVNSHGFIQNQNQESTTSPLMAVPIGRKADSVSDTCTICLETIARGDIINDLENCCHTFHSKCIAQWLKIKNSCPTCNSTPAFSTS